MPFVSEAQRRYLQLHRPDLAAEFAAATPPDAKLPEHAPRAEPKGKAKSYVKPVKAPGRRRR